MKNYNIFENSKGQNYIFIPVQSAIKKITPLISNSDKLSFIIQYNAIMNGNDILSRIINMGKHIIDVDILFRKFESAYVYSNITNENACDILGESNVGIQALKSTIQMILGEFSKYKDVIIINLKL